MNRVTLGDFLGTELEENFMDFDLTEIQEVLSNLKDIIPVDLPHAELLQQQSLRGADVISEFLGKIVKTIGYLETKVNSTKNKVSLEYSSPDEKKVTADMRRNAGEASPEVEEIQIRLAKAKGSKSLLEKKYDTLVRTYYFYKEIAAGLRKTILGYSIHSTSENEQVAEGYR